MSCVVDGLISKLAGGGAQSRVLAIALHMCDICKADTSSYDEHNHAGSPPRGINSNLRGPHV
jgi:hypothetical protein